MTITLIFHSGDRGAGYDTFKPAIGEARHTTWYRETTKHPGDVRWCYRGPDFGGDLRNGDTVEVVDDDGHIIFTETAIGFHGFAPKKHPFSWENEPAGGAK